MLMWYVDSLAVVMQLPLLQVPALVEVLVQYGWIMWNVQAKSLLYHIVHMPVLEEMTAVTMKMLVLSVQVRDLAHFKSMNEVIFIKLTTTVVVLPVICRFRGPVG